MKLSNKYILVITAALLLSCNKDSGTNSELIVPKMDGILPLATGNAWQFRRLHISSTGQVIDTSIVTMSVGVGSVVNNEIGYELSFFFPLFLLEGDPSGSTVLWSNKPDGFYRTEVRHSSRPPLVDKILSYPTTPGDSSTNPIVHTVKTITLSEEVVVAAGIFSCIRFDIFRDNLPSLKAQIFAVPHVGIVKVVSFEWGHYVYELTSYQLN